MIRAFPNRLNTRTHVFYSTEEFLRNDELLFIFRESFILYCLIISYTSFILAVVYTPTLISSICNVRPSINFIISPIYILYIPLFSKFCD